MTENQNKELKETIKLRRYKGKGLSLSVNKSVNKCGSTYHPTKTATKKYDKEQQCHVRKKNVISYFWFAVHSLSLSLVFTVSRQRFQSLLS